MKTKLAICALVAALALMLTANIQAQTTNPPYLSQFPVERVKAEMRGSDAIDTAARQTVAFWWLNKFIVVLAGPRGERMEYTTDESRIRRPYLDAVRSYLLNKNTNTASNWEKRLDYYTNDPAFLDELFRRFFTPEFRAGYFRATAKQAPQLATSQPTTRPAAPAAAQPSTSAGGSAGPYLAQGDKYREAKDYAKAIEAYNKAISLQPSFGAYNLLGSAYLGLKQYPKAAAAFQQAIRLKPDEGNFHLSLGVTYNVMEQYANAIEALREAVRLKTDLDPAINQLGNAYYRWDQFSEAVTAYKEAVRLQPNNATYRHNLGLMYIEMGKKEEALQVQKSLQKIDQTRANKLSEEIRNSYSDSDKADALFIHATLLVNDKRYVYALRAFRRIIVLKPQPEDLAGAYGWIGYIYAGAYGWIGYIYKEQKKHKQAVEAYEQAAAALEQTIRLKPREADNYVGLGKIYVELGRKNDALQVQRRLQTIDKAKAQELYAEIIKPATSQPTNQSGSPATGPTSGAGRPSRPARGAPPVQSGPGTPSKPPQSNVSAGTGAEAYRAEGNKYLGAKDYAKAIQAYKKAIALEPSHGGAYYSLALLYQIQGQHQLAISAYKQGMTLVEPDAADFIVLGHAHRKLKQYDEALKAYRSAIRMQPDAETLAETHSNIGYVYIEMEQYGNAVPAFREVLRLNPKDADASNALGNVYRNLLRIPEAVAVYKQTIRLKPDHASAHFNLGYLYVVMGEKQEAQQIYRTLLTLDRKFAQMLYAEINKMK